MSRWLPSSKSQPSSPVTLDYERYQSKVHKKIVIIFIQRTLKARKDIRKGSVAKFQDNEA